jgi:hypothetical protein
MLFAHVLFVIFVQFEIFDSVVCSDVINVMNTFFLSERSAKVLFHNIAMLQHTLPVDINANIPQWTHARLTLSQICPIWGNTVVTMPKKTAPMCRTDLSASGRQNSRAALNFTNFPFSHIPIIARGERNVN